MDQFYDVCWQMFLLSPIEVQRTKKLFVKEGFPFAGTKMISFYIVLTVVVKAVQMGSDVLCRTCTCSSEEFCCHVIDKV